MKKLIEKHQLKNKGRGKIIHRFLERPITIIPYNKPKNASLITTEPSVPKYPFLGLPRDVIGNAAQSIEQLKRILDELDRNAEGIRSAAADKKLENIEKEREFQNQYNQAELNLHWLTKGFRNYASIPLLGLPFNIAEGLYAGMNYLTGNKGAALYYWNDTNKNARMQGLGLTGILANTNPVTGGLFDGALLGEYVKSLDEQGKFLYPERLTREDKANLGIAAFPFFFPYIKNRNMLMAKAGDMGEGEIGGIESLSNEIVFPARGINPVTKTKFLPILKSDLPEYLKMLNEGKYDLIPNGDGGFYKIYKFKDRQWLREDMLTLLFDKHFNRQLTPLEKLLALQAPDIIRQIENKYGITGFIPENWFNNRPWLGSKLAGAVTLLDIDIWNSHIPEYYSKLEELIRNGDLVKLPNNSWVGRFADGIKPVLPEEYVVAHSNAFKNNGWFYDGINRGRAMWSLEYEDLIRNGGIGRTKWTTDNREQLGIFSGERQPGGRTIQTIVANTNGTSEVPTRFAKEARRVEHGVQYSPNVEYKGTVGNYTVYGEDVPIKSLRGNNGDFSRLRQGIFKFTIPGILGGSTIINNLNNNE